MSVEPEVVEHLFDGRVREHFAHAIDKLPSVHLIREERDGVKDVDYLGDRHLCMGLRKCLCPRVTVSRMQDICVCGRSCGAFRHMTEMSDDKSRIV